MARSPVTSTQWGYLRALWALGKPASVGQVFDYLMETKAHGFTEDYKTSQTHLNLLCAAGHATKELTTHPVSHRRLALYSPTTSPQDALGLEFDRLFDHYLARDPELVATAEATFLKHLRLLRAEQEGEKTSAGKKTRAGKKAKE
jgi:hypothetical protein